MPFFNVNVVCAREIVFDGTAEARNIECLTDIDEYTRECLAIDLAGSIGSKRVRIVGGVIALASTTLRASFCFQSATAGCR